MSTEQSQHRTHEEHPVTGTVTQLDDAVLARLATLADRVAL
jgi:hypothetical protein